MKRVLLALVFILAVSTHEALAADWKVPGDFTTIQDAINSASVANGDTIMVGPGVFDGALVNKQVEIKGVGRAIVNNGPLHPAGLTQGFRMLAGSGGSTISHLIFDNVDLAVMNGGGVHNVTITQNTFLNPIQGVSDWRGSGWEITQNEIIGLRTRCGGGIGILVADFSGGVVSDNVVSHNKVSGTLAVSATDCGGYNGTGIVLYADFRWDAQGASQIAYNRVVKNHIALVSDTPAVVDVVAIELTEADYLGQTPVIYNNAIGFNDLRGTAAQIALTPATLDNPTNAISRNLGENRGHGLHPSLFGPGGN